MQPRLDNRSGQPGHPGMNRLNGDWIAGVYGLWGASESLLSLHHVSLGPGVLDSLGLGSRSVSWISLIFWIFWISQMEVCRVCPSITLLGKCTDRFVSGLAISYGTFHHGKDHLRQWRFPVVREEIDDL